MDDNRFHHHPCLRAVADEDVRYVLEKDRSYGASWKQAGGRSAWFMLRRKMDRMIQMLKRPDGNGIETAIHHLPMGGPPPGRCYQVRPETMDWVRKALVSEDIFAKIQAEPADGRDGTVLAEVRDLRRYLLLVEAEMVARGVVADPTPRQEAVAVPTLPKVDMTMLPRNHAGPEPGRDGYVGLRRGNPEVDRISAEARRQMGEKAWNMTGADALEQAGGNGASSGDEWAPGVPLGTEAGR